MSYNDFVGIDVSKATLDYYIDSSGKHGTVCNSAQGIGTLLGIIAKQSNGKALVLCEATGGYESLLAKLCFQKGLGFAIVQPRHVRLFARAMGITAKTDAIDAKVIAAFCKVRADTIKEYSYAPHHETLRSMVRRRNELVERKVALGNHLEHIDDTSPVYYTYHNELSFIKQTIKELEKLMMVAINRDSSMKSQFKLLTTIQGIGPKVACEIIAEIPEILELTPNQLSALVGLAPMNKDSGTYKGKRTIHGGRKQVRKALYMAAVTAIKYDNDLKVFYNRLVNNGKTFKVAITAVCRKLILIAQAVLKTHSPWKPYINS